MDDIARDYLLLALSLGELEEGFVDAYYGPPEIRAQAVARNATPAELAAEATALRARVATDVYEPQRARWLDRQLLAIGTLARRLAGDGPPYLEEVAFSFDAVPQRVWAVEYSVVRRELDSLVPGSGDVRARLEERDRRLTIPEERLPAVLDWLADELRRRCSAVFPIPAGEELSVSMVTDEPWSAYNWYDGNLRSRIEVNVDQPIRAHQLIATMAHETFPGHHLEHAWKETRLVREQGRAEATVQLINTPEAYISEGLAELGTRFVAGEGEWQQLLLEVCARAGLPMTVADADVEWRITRLRRRLRGSGGDSALMLHVDKVEPEEVIAFLENEALQPRERAERHVQFANHPLWRTYVFCYVGGERLLTRWCDAAGDVASQRERFFRLLTEQITPSAIAEELETAA